MSGKESTVSLDADSGERRPGSSKSKWIIGVLVVIVIGLAAGLGVTLSSSGGDSCDTVASDSAAAETAPAVTPGEPYYLRDHMEGETFFDHFDFQDADQFWAKFWRGDPTNGFVRYVNASLAKEHKLTSITADGRPRIDVEHKEMVGEDIGRKSVRIRSKKTWRTGLFVADVEHMPEGRGTWPALWTVDEPNWPNQAEIDIIEGADNMYFTQVTVHTGPNCTMYNEADPEIMTGSGFIYPNCNAENGQTGCGVQGPLGSFGPPFNKAGGGTFAMEWSDDFLKSWFFPRGESPQEKDASQKEKPTPWTWPKPFAVWTLGANCPSDKYFGPHNLVINTCLCGDWAGRFWWEECVELVRDHPEKFVDAYWIINYVSVFQTGEKQTPEQTSDDYPRGI